MLRLSLGVPRLTAVWVPIQASWVESIRAEWTGRVAARSAAAARAVRTAEVRTAGLTNAWLTWRAYAFAAMMDRLAHRMSGWRALSSQLELLPAAAAARQALRRRGLQRGLRGWLAWRERREWSEGRRSEAQVAAAQKVAAPPLRPTPHAAPAARAREAPCTKGASPAKGVASCGAGQPTARPRKLRGWAAPPAEGIASRSKQWAARRDEALRRERAARAARELEHCTFSPELNARSLRIGAARTAHQNMGTAIGAARTAAARKPPAGPRSTGSPPIISSTRYARPTAPVTPPTPYPLTGVATYARRERAGAGAVGTGLALSRVQATEPAVASAADAAEQLVRHRLKVLAARVQQMRVLHSAADALSSPKS